MSWCWENIRIAVPMPATTPVPTACDGAEQKGSWLRTKESECPCMLAGNMPVSQVKYSKIFLQDSPHFKNFKFQSDVCPIQLSQINSFFLLNGLLISGH